MNQEKLQRLLSVGFVIAGLTNIIGMLIISKGLNNPALVAADPNVFSTYGQAMVLVWGLAYLSVAKSFTAVPWLCLAFAIEKLAYVAAWVCWWMNDANQWQPVWDASPLAGFFMLGYGPNDLLFAGMFVAAYFVARSK